MDILLAWYVQLSSYQNWFGLFFTKISELNDGKARHICIHTQCTADIVDRFVFCLWKQQTRRQQGGSRFITYDKLTFKSKKLSLIIIVIIVGAIVPHWVHHWLQSQKQQVLEATWKSERLNKGDQLPI